MPTPKNQRRGGTEKNRKGKLSEKASSFHGSVVAERDVLPRPRTVPDLFAGRRSGGSSAEDVVALGTPPAKPMKLLLNVTIQRSLGAVRVVMPLEATVEDLIGAAMRQYSKEARVPALQSSDASAFNLHYSQFSLESLDRAAKLMELGSRNFFLCSTRAAVGASTWRCSKEADEGTAKGLPWLKFMDFLK